MSLKTRLDGRSEDNSGFKIKDENGDVVAKVDVLSNATTTLNISTKEGLHIEKANGFKSKS